MSFNPPAYGGNIHTLASLSNANYPTAGNNANGAVDAFAPRSATLYHELFHLTVGNDQAPDFTKILSPMFGSLWRVGSWYYQNAPAGAAPVVFAGPDRRPHAAKTSPSD
ncbi:hypothetical protein CDV55_106265 [Aspergillus turcosus]|uniref:Uncharacterized protein n=1 Tax=Aspergillus turcosus TaxID=1245748 RepID=A0A229XMP6_9EURO|nr:hypothetical protein CDV55_106265 [Aspergillus turcosus]RLM01700.1 hypothetical protein CFD26_109011 [Aspergillus turcosus]